MAKGLPDFTRSMAVNVEVEASYGFLLGRLFYNADPNFTVAESPRTLDVRGALGRNGHEGFISVDADGDLGVEISDDGINFSPQVVLKPAEIMGLGRLDINKIRLTAHKDTAYRVVVI